MFSSVGMTPGSSDNSDTASTSSVQGSHQVGPSNTPLATLAMIAYNHEPFIEDALSGALVQSYEPLEIIISDDCSEDGTFDRIQQIAASYQGPHKLVVTRNQQNLGLARNLNRVMELAASDYIVLAAGDDISMPNRVQRMVEVLRTPVVPPVLSSSSLVMAIDSSGSELGPYLPAPPPGKLTLRSAAYGRTDLLGCAGAWHRLLFDYFGGLDAEIVNEDTLLNFRGALIGQIVVVPEALVQYRLHPHNVWFTDVSAMEGAGQLLEVLRRSTRSRIALNRTMKQDVQLVMQREPGRSAALAPIERIVDQSLRDCQTESDLYELNRKSEQIVVLIRSALRGTPPRRLIRLALTHLTPNLYFRLERRRHLHERSAARRSKRQASRIQ